MLLRKCVVCDTGFNASGRTKTCQPECRRAHTAQYKREWRKDNAEKVRYASEIANAKKRERRLNEKKAEALHTPLDRVLARYAKASSF